VDDPSKRLPGMPPMMPPKFQPRESVRPTLAAEPVVLARPAVATVPDLQGPPCKRNEPGASARSSSGSGRPTSKPKIEGAMASSPVVPKPVPSKAPAAAPSRAPGPSVSATQPMAVAASPVAPAPSQTPAPSQAPVVAPSQTLVAVPAQAPSAVQLASSVAPSQAPQESQVPRPRWGRPTYTPTQWQWSRWCGYCPWRTEADRRAYIASLDEQEEWDNCWNCGMHGHSKHECTFWVRE